jgi:hypothetical protein
LQANFGVKECFIELDSLKDFDTGVEWFEGTLFDEKALTQLDNFNHIQVRILPSLKVADLASF